MEALKIGLLVLAVTVLAGGCQSVDVEGGDGAEGGAAAGADDGQGAGADDGQRGDAGGDGDGAAGGAGAEDGGDAGGDAGGDDGGADPCGADPWADVLAGYVKDECTDYKGLAADAATLAKLQCVVDDLAQATPSSLADRHHKLAFWLNAYNSLMIHGVLGHLRTDAAWTPASNDFKVFSEDPVTVAGTPLVLNNIEYQIILGRDGGTEQMQGWHGEIFPDDMPQNARVHAALNCAALSCPSLHLLPFSGADLEGVLEARATRWVDDPAKGSGPEGISQLFEWFAEDFNAYSGSVEVFIGEHRTGGADGVDLGTIKPYDWRLNRCP